MILTRYMHKMNVAPVVDELELDKDKMRELWLLFLYRGISIFLFGFASIAWPGITLVALAYVFAIYILFIGAIDIINGFRMVNSQNLWFLKVLLGIVEVGVAMYLLRSGFVVTTVIYLQTLGLILMLQAVIDSTVALKSDFAKGLKALTVISAIFGFIIGVFLVRHPINSGLTFVWIIGFYGVIVGSMTIAAALSIRPPKTA